MLKSKTDALPRHKPLRLWPGVVFVVLQWLVWIFLPVVMPDAIEVSVFGGLLGWIAIVVWWGFFSNAPRFERWGAIVVMILTMVATSFVIHESIATAMMGMMFTIYVTPGLSLAFVIWTLVSRQFSEGLRYVTMVATIILACGLWTLLRTDGMTGNASQDLAWRWGETYEDRLLAQADDEELMPLPSIPADVETRANWPGFRGLNRDGVINDLRIRTDWSVSPPEELWRRPIGPGISSFAVKGGLLYTQEQRGDDEIVACYYLISGQPVWRYRDTARFWDSHAGAGPRGTPTLFDGRVYTLGATGILNVLEANDGTLIWSRNSVSDTEVEIPEWGISSSPLVVDSVVIVAVVGRLAAYDINSGNPLWFGPDGGDGYSSPHLVTIDGVNQILLMSGNGVVSVAPTDGNLLWEYTWPPGTRIVQPALTAEGDLLIGGGELNGIRRITIRHVADGWTIKERWTSKRLKPYFNDFVVHKGHVYGFYGSRLACIDVEQGNRKWMGGRFGYGQLILLADQDLLMVQSEKGELTLVMATPDQFKELARFPAIEGKTWNHPVLVGDVLLVRNSQEMAAFRLSLAGG